MPLSAPTTSASPTSAPSFDFEGALASGASPQAITNFLSSKGMGNLATTYFNQQPTAPTTFTSGLNALKTYVGNVGSDLKGGLQNAVSDLENTADEGSTKQAEGGFQAVGDLSGAALSPLTEAIKGIANGLAGNKAVQDVANSPVGDAVAGAEKAATNNPVTAKLAEWAQQYPDAAKDLGALGNIAAVGTSFAGGGEAAEAVPDLANAAADKVSSALPNLDMAPEGSTAAPKSANDILTSRTADATPDYSKKMVSDYIQNPKGETVPRVNEGEGVFGDRTVNTSKSEAANGAELAKIKDYPDNGTALQKAQAVHDEITSEAEGLKSQLAAEDKAAPLVKGAKEQVTKGITDNMTAAFDEPPKSIVGKYAQEVSKAANEYDGTRAGLLKLRQNLDGVYEDARGKSAFGSDHRNALDEMHTSIRDYLNKELHESTTSTDVKASLEKQAKLFRAKDVLDSKAETEATSKAGRFMQAHPQARYLSRFAERRGLYEGLKIAGTAGATALAVKKVTQK